ncbi:MAG: MBL fold metallo-hydrolase [Methanotrichaceae archaeon]
MGRKASAALLITAVLLAAAFSGCMEKKPAENISTTNAKPGIANNLTVHYLDVGQGDSILIQFAGKNMLIDGGETEMGSRVVSYLRSHNVTSLDLVVATHPHSDHIGGLAVVLKTFPVRNFLDSGQAYSSQTYENLLRLIEEKNIDYAVGTRGQRINFDPRLQITVLNPPLQMIDDNVNDNSIVLKIAYDKISFLFMGDAEATAEKSMLSSGIDLHVDIIKVGHHGSSTSSSPEFLKAASPDVKVIEVGKGNDYGHPAQKILNALMRTYTHIERSALYRTDLNGNINITTDGTGYYITTERGSGKTGQSYQAVQLDQASHSGQMSKISIWNRMNQSDNAQNSAAQPNAAYHITINAIQFDAPGDDRKNLNGEWVQMKNSGNSSVDMTGWILDSSGERVYTFPEFSLASGALVKVFSGSGSNGPSKLYMRLGSPVWSNDGDIATLKDTSGHIVSQRSG